MSQEDNGTGRHALPPPIGKTSPSFIDSLLRGVRGMKSDPPEEKFQKRAKWVKWVVGTVLTIFIAGYVVAKEIGALARTDDVDQAITEFAEEHEADHAALTHRIRHIRAAQRVQSAQQQVLNTQVTLVLERMENRPRTRTAVLRRQRRERSLRLAISEQQVVASTREQELAEYDDEEDESE